MLMIETLKQISLEWSGLFGRRRTALFGALKAANLINDGMEIGQNQLLTDWLRYPH